MTVEEKFSWQAVECFCCVHYCLSLLHNKKCDVLAGALDTLFCKEDIRIVLLPERFYYMMPTLHQ